MKYFYSDPLAAAYQAREFGVKYSNVNIDYQYIKESMEPICQLLGVEACDEPSEPGSCFLDIEPNEKYEVHPDSELIFREMPHEIKRGLMALGMWPLNDEGYKEILLTAGQVAIVDEDDYERLNKLSWQVSSRGYANRRVYLKGNQYSTLIMHREIMQPPDDMQVDHINGNKLDNRKQNLRICTASQNSMNSNRQKGLYRGVTWHKRDRKWRANIGANREKIYIGQFDCPHEAAKAYNKKALELHGEFARLNVMPEVENETT